MIEQVELSQIDIRFESYRLKSVITENNLLTSIIKKGICEPLEGVDKDNKRILLNGFKRYRCAKKLNINIVPYISLGNDEVNGIMQLIRVSNSNTLNIIEQAILIEELKNVHKLSNFEIAESLEKSKSWVSMRTGLITEMSGYVKKTIFSGFFPAYAYMYCLRQFIRMNKVKQSDIDEFVKAVSGKNLSIRDIELLANAYFNGSEELREQIRKGNIKWELSRLKNKLMNSSGCTSHENQMLRDIEIVLKYMQRVIFKSDDPKLNSNSFFAQAEILSGGIIRQIEPFSKAIRRINDRSRKTKECIQSS